MHRAGKTRRFRRNGDGQSLRHFIVDEHERPIGNRSAPQQGRVGRRKVRGIEPMESLRTGGLRSIWSGRMNRRDGARGGYAAKRHHLQIIRPKPLSAWVPAANAR